MSVPSWSCHTRVAQTQIYSCVLLLTQWAHDDHSDVAINAAYWDDPYFLGNSFFFFCRDLARVKYKTGRSCWVRCQRGDLGP